MRTQLPPPRVARTSAVRPICCLCRPPMCDAPLTTAVNRWVRRPLSVSERQVDRALGVQPRGVEYRDRRVGLRDEEVDLGAAEEDPFGAPFGESGDDLPVLLARAVVDHADAELVV